MTQKLSPQKVSKMMALYFEGYPQSQIAEKLKINQATVSLYVVKFEALAEQGGLKAAGKEYGIMNQVETLHSLAAELKAAKLTAEEAKAGLKMVLVLQKCGVKQEDYQDLAQACTKMKAEDLIKPAVKLNQLENSTGKTWEEIVAEAAGAHQQLEQTQAQLESMTGKLNASKEELVTIENKKKQASQDLAAHMEQVGVDMDRLKLVEALALALKQAGISNNELQDFVHRQQLLDKVGIGLDTLLSILEKAKVATAYDGGKELLKTMSDYGGLVEVVKALQAKVEALAKQADGLEERAKLKGKIDSDIAKLKAEKKLASQDLAAHMEQVGVDMDRLKLVETLALALKQAGISNNELQDFIHRQQLVDKAGIGLDTLLSILEEAKIATAYDGGKELLKTMSDYGGLVEVAKALQTKVEALDKQADGLEERAKLKGKIDSEIAKLKGEKASLEGYVAGLHGQKDELDHIKSEISSLGQKKAELDHEISEREKYKGSLDDDIKSREEKVSDLKELESKRDGLLQRLSEIDAKVKGAEKRWEIFEALLGLVQSSSLPDLQKFIQTIPVLLDKVKQEKYSSERLRTSILTQLAGPALQLLKCTDCQARFAVNKWPKSRRYYCPICGFHTTVVVDQDALGILKAELSTLRQLPPGKWTKWTVVKQPETNEETKG